MAPEALTRKHTFLFADLAGFTAMTEACGDEVAAETVADFYAGVRRLLADYEAEEIKSIGDALMLRVPQAPSAVRLAVRILEEVGRRHGALAVRVGLHTGPAVERDGDWFGATVNLAARVTAAAHPGEVWLTDAAHAAARGALDRFEVRSGGRMSFKNVAEPVAVYALTLAAQPTVAGLPVDPVCRMAVDPMQSEERRIYRGVEYQFCAPACATVFDRHPERYTGRRPASAEL